MKHYTVPRRALIMPGNTDKGEGLPSTAQVQYVQREVNDVLCERDAELEARKAIDKKRLKLERLAHTVDI